MQTDTEEERQENQKKGCITPADGTPRRSVLKVVPYKKGDVTRRDNALDNVIGAEDTSDDYLVVKKTYLVAGLIIVLLAVIMIIFGRNKLKCFSNFSK